MYQNSVAKLSFIGDISLNDEYRLMYHEGLNPFAEIEPILINCDLVVGNLECLIQSTEGENTNKKPQLHTDLGTMNFLKNINLGLACLANNHVYDNLEDGFVKTINYLESNKIKYIGASVSGDEYLPFIYTKNDITIGILNYVTDDTNPNLPKDAKVNLNIFRLDQVILDIKSLKDRVNHIVIFLHWGGTMEGSMYPDKCQPILAREMIDAGADIIIGHHSHTLQPYEIYKDKYIFYSLGNFCFSDVSVNEKTVEFDKKRSNPSIILNVLFEKSKFQISFNGIINNNGFIKLSDFVENKKVRLLNLDKSLYYNSKLWSMYLLYEKRVYPIVAYFFSNNRNPIKQLYKLRWVSVKKHFKRLVYQNHK